MGCGCSKTSSIGVKEHIASSNKLLVSEVVGSAGTITGGVDNNEALPEVTVNQDTNLPIIQDTQEMATQEAESINTYNNENNSAARATLIFPSYSGYRNNEQFQIKKQPTGLDSAPTAFVTPFQFSPSSPYMNRNTTNFVTQRTSFLSGNSPRSSPKSSDRSRFSAFDNYLSSVRRGSIESRGFDSDLESESEEINVPNSVVQLEDENEVTTDTALAETNRKTPLISKETSTNTASNAPKIDAETETTREIYIKTVDASVGTNSEDVYRSEKTTTVQVDLKRKNKQTTSSMAVGTEPNAETNLTETVPKTPLISKKTSTKTTFKRAPKTDTETKPTGKTYIKTVDACVGTDSEEFYRSKTTKKVQVDLKRKNKQTSSMAVGTEPELTSPPTKSTKAIGVGTDDVGISVNQPEPSKTSASTGTQNNFTIKMVDACVGTDSDEYYRSTKEITIQVNRKKKKPKTSSKETVTDAKISSPQLIKSSPRVKKISVTKIATPVAANHRRPSATPSLAPSIRRISSATPEPNPIIETLENAFIRFARYGDINSEGLEMNNKNWAKLCRDCEFIDNRGVLIGDIDVIFSRHKPKGHRLIDFGMFLNCLNEIADRKFSNKIKNEWERREVIYRNVIGTAPELLGVTATSKTGNVNRMTDHTLYPVSHKMRFDGEGKGLGIEEKFEVLDSQMGYVQGYKDRDTYELKMLGFAREKSNLSNNVKFPSPKMPRAATSSRNLAVN